MYMYVDAPLKAQERERDEISAFNYVNVWVIAFGAHCIYNGNTAIHFMLHLKFSLL